MLDETSLMTRTNDINFHPTFLQDLSSISSNMLGKMLDWFNEALILKTNNSDTHPVAVVILLKLIVALILETNNSGTHPVAVVILLKLIVAN